MASRKKNRPSGKQYSRATGAADRKARIILIAVLAGIVILMVLLFLGTYAHGPQP